MTEKKLPVIGIGASAGGLEPLELFFDHVNLKSGYAYVVVQHLAPNHKSLMDELLARHTELPIKIIEDGMSLEPNTIYLNPPKKFVTISAGELHLSDKEDRKLSFPITTFFQSLAKEQTDNCSAIILSGTGSDGSEGIKFIKEKGGIVLVQSPESSKFDGMPKNAINTNCVDKICLVENMPKELSDFFQSREKLSLINFQTKENTEEINSILKEIKKKTRIDFTGYKFSTMFRRTTRRMSLQGYDKLNNYLTYIQENANEAHLLAKELLIGVTRFFRDSETFEQLEEIIIPKIIEQTAETKNIRIWVTACSSGEEAYSIAILFKEYLKRNNLQYDIKIFATDLDVDAIHTASNPVFPDRISTEIDSRLLSTYFIKRKEGFKIAKEIRDMIVFSVHNLIQDPPFGKIDFISCRNFLIYLNPDIQNKVFSTFQFSLKKGGFLLLGSSESLGTELVHFTEVDQKHKIYSNKTKLNVLSEGNNKANQNQLRMKMQNKGSKNVGKELQVQESPKKILQHIHEYLIQQYVPDALIYRQNFDLVHTTGNINKWLRLPVGEVSLNILRMLPEDLQLSFELASNKLISEKKSITLSNVAVNEELAGIYGSDNINIHFKELEVNNSPLCIALFEHDGLNEKSIDSEKTVLNLDSKEKIELLENELKVNKENLQTTIEELESSNEELQASNEELQSSNEELESVNEELYSVNAEFQEKVEELTEANNDLNNFISSTHIAMVFLDSNLNIRKFTPAVKEILNLLPNDIGRPIHEIKSKIRLEEFTDKVKEVYETLIPFQTSVYDIDNQKYAFRITPFRTVKNEIKGIVLTFIDITAFSQIRKDLKLSNTALENINSKYESQSDLFELITNNSNDLISVHDLNGDIDYASPSSYHLIGYTPEELIGKNSEKIIKSKQHKEVWKKSFEKTKQKNKINPFRVLLKSKKQGDKWFEIQLNEIADDDGIVTKVLSTAKDIENKKYFEDELQKLSLIAEQTTSTVIITDIKGEITYVNDSFIELTGFDKAFCIGKKPGDFLQGPDSDPDTVKAMRNALKQQRGFNVDIINYSKEGHKYWTNINCEPMHDDNNQFIGFFSVQHEVSHHKDYEEQIDRLNRQLKSRNENLSELNKSLEEFAYVASHDLKEPSRNIKSLLDLILRNADGQLNDKLTKYIQLALKAGDKMNQLINSLLEYSRSGVLKEDLSPITLDEITKEVQFSLRNLLKENKVSIKVKDNLGSFNAYPILLGRLFQNLIQNAIKYKSEKKPLITIEATENQDFYLFSVSDNGVGISSRNFDRIFQIFQKVHENDGDSHGIGLAICKKIAETHHGEISVESEEGKGSTFHFSISKDL